MAKLAFYFPIEMYLWLGSHGLIGCGCELLRNKGGSDCSLPDERCRILTLSSYYRGAWLMRKFAQPNQTTIIPGIQTPTLPLPTPLTDLCVKCLAAKLNTTSIMSDNIFELKLFTLVKRYNALTPWMLKKQNN